MQVNIPTEVGRFLNTFEPSLESSPVPRLPCLFRTCKPQRPRLDATSWHTLASERSAGYFQSLRWMLLSLQGSPE